MIASATYRALTRCLPTNYPDRGHAPRPSRRPGTEPCRRRYRGEAWRRLAAPRRARGGFRRRLMLATCSWCCAVVAVGIGLLWAEVAAFNDKVTHRSLALLLALLLPLNGRSGSTSAMYGYGGAVARGHVSEPTRSTSCRSIRRPNTTTMIPIPRDLWIQGCPSSRTTARSTRPSPTAIVNGGAREGGTVRGRGALRRHGAEDRALDGDRFHRLPGDGRRRRRGDGRQPGRLRLHDRERLLQRRNLGRRLVRDGPNLALDGARALDYTRARYTSDPAEASDFARSVRQSRVLAALQDQARRRRAQDRSVPGWR